MTKFKRNQLIIFTSFCLIFGASVNGQNIYEDKYQWQIPGGKYVDPVSFFSLHGYVNALYAGPSDQWSDGYFNGLGVPGQMNIPYSNNNSFTQDAALWIGSELTDGVSVVIELHLHNTGTGHHREFEGIEDPAQVRAGVGLVITEANVRFKILQNYLALSAGTFWSVFGIQNKDWLSAQNLFSTIPLASGAYLTHYNERGVRIDGYLNNGDWGMNYVFSLGNGYNTWDFEGYSHLDFNDDKTINSRISFFPGLGDQLNIGVSYGTGLIFEQNINADPLTERFYNSEFDAFGLDLTGNYAGLNLRSYFITSNERFYNNQENIKLPNTGFMAEISFDYDLEGKLGLKSIHPKFRFDRLDKSEFINSQSDVYTTVSAGLNLQIKENFMFSIDYNWIDEEKNTIDNNRIIARLTANF